MKLIAKLIAGIIAGILIGLYLPTWVSQLLLTFKGLFGQLLFFTVPLLILFLSPVALPIYRKTPAHCWVKP